jgi:hypothetical protein
MVWRTIVNRINRWIWAGGLWSMRRSITNGCSSVLRLKRLTLLTWRIGRVRRLRVLSIISIVVVGRWSGRWWLTVLRWSRLMIGTRSRLV